MKTDLNFTLKINTLKFGSNKNLPLTLSREMEKDERKYK